MKSYDISKELWRDYTWTDPITKEIRHQMIHTPKLLYYERGHTTHRIVDSTGTSWCVPAVGYFGCVVRWKNPTGEEPVNF